MNDEKTNNHEENLQTDNRAPDNDAPKTVIEDVQATPPHETAAPQAETEEQHRLSVRLKISEAIVYWLRHYWDTPREKCKSTDVLMVILTMAVAIAAFCSAGIFQGQLTVARETMESQTRPWVGNGEIKVNQATFLVYPDNPIEARTQVDSQVDIPLKDVGNSPALNVETGVIWTMTPQIAAPPTMETMMESACGDADKNAKRVGGSVVPEQSGNKLGVAHKL